MTEEKATELANELAAAEAFIELAKKHQIRKLKYHALEFELTGYEAGPVIPEKPSLYDMMPPDDQLLFMASEGMEEPAQDEK